MKSVLAGTTAWIFSLMAVAQPGPVKLSDMLKIRQPGNVDMSADGSKAVFTLTGSMQDEKNKWEYPYQTQIWMVALNGGQPRPLTSSKEGSSQPALSPDGSTLAFVRQAEQKPQIFLMNLRDGGEPRQLTTLATGAANPQWSADGKKILFTSSIGLQELYNDSILNPGKKLPEWSLEKPGFANNAQLLQTGANANPDGDLTAIRAWLLLNEKDSKAKVLNKLNFQQEATTSSAISFTHIFITDTESGSAARALTSGFYSYSNPQWVGNTYQVVAERVFNASLHPDKAQLEPAIFRLGDGTKATLLLGAADSAFGSSSVSPSGKWMAFTCGKTSFVNQRKLFVAKMDNPSVRTGITLDRNAGNFNWSNDDKYLYFTCQSNGGVVLYRLTLATRALERLTSFDEGVGSFDEEAGRLVFVKTEVANPFEIYQSDAQAKNQQRVSSFNQEWLSQRSLSFPEKRQFTNEKGGVVEYWVMKPYGWQPGKKYPTILEIHGGPTAMWGPGESSMWHEFQYYCAQGYAVVYSNPRGSGGYSESFLQANMNDWGKGPMSDVLTALDKSAREFSWIDTSRLAVTGGSYAGYLVGYILGNDQRFKVACAQRGVYDLRTFFGEGNAWRLVPNYFGGYPWQKATYDVLERESPINYVQNITTPLIIFHGENDLRTGVIQSEQFYRSLKVLGKTVEYVRHPGATHEITRSGNNRQRMDQMLRTYEFFERFITH